MDNPGSATELLSYQTSEMGMSALGWTILVYQPSACSLAFLIGCIYFAWSFVVWKHFSHGLLVDLHAIYFISIKKLFQDFCLVIFIVMLDPKSICLGVQRYSQKSDKISAE